MEIQDLITAYHGSREKEVRGIFASIFILQNRLQTIFDKVDPQLTLKQFMLIVMIKHSTGETTFTHLGKLLGSSRQNVKKLALSLEKKGFIEIAQEPSNKRRTSLSLTKKAQDYYLEVNALHEERLTNLFDGYSDAEIQLFYEMITKLYAGIEKEEETVNHP